MKHKDFDIAKSKLTGEIKHWYDRIDSKKFERVKASECSFRDILHIADKSKYRYSYSSAQMYVTRYSTGVTYTMYRSHFEKLATTVGVIGKYLPPLHYDVVNPHGTICIEADLENIEPYSIEKTLTEFLSFHNDGHKIFDAISLQFERIMSEGFQTT